MKRIIISATFASLGLASSAAHATGVPVVDVANLANSAQQVLAWAEQYKQMVSQYEQMKEQYKAVTGDRGFGGMAKDNSPFKDIVPMDIADVYGSVLAGGGLTDKAAEIRGASMEYDCQERSGKDQSTCKAMLDTNAQTQAYEAKALDVLNKRMIQINTLREGISSAKDPKAIAELQARIAIEGAQVTNDSNRIAIMNAMAQTQQRAAQQVLKEREMKNMSRTNSAIDTFVYTPKSK
ncbi:P-type DNA transfer protein VirB5 [Massilia pseudoviolaceinigra]|uniref:P-type DNA transfer protein VirB5 n=1 Tax=Massilia pseudoviolaceinigra TaxID=3057165 RepID=UPI002796BF33|nr:P-type DNA transfer protein VirB5 [Massilia sp. CCM 9206]MDQ1922678.1 P-type DNA transfer protein VirB5 [Massilia sp. CCM 9206]